MSNSIINQPKNVHRASSLSKGNILSVKIDHVRKNFLIIVTKSKIFRKPFISVSIHLPQITNISLILLLLLLHTSGPFQVRCYGKIRWDPSLGLLQKFFKFFQLWNTNLMLFLLKVSLEFLVHMVQIKSATMVIGWILTFRNINVV